MCHNTEGLRGRYYPPRGNRLLMSKGFSPQIPSFPQQTQSFLADCEMFKSQLQLSKPFHTLSPAIGVYIYCGQVF